MSKLELSLEDFIRKDNPPIFRSQIKSAGITTFKLNNSGSEKWDDVGRMETWRDRLIPRIKRALRWIVGVLKSVNNFFASPVIAGVQFVTKGGFELEVFVGMQMHVSHEGECLADMKCKLGAVQKIEVGDGCVNLTMADHTFSFIGVELRTVHKTRGG